METIRLETLSLSWQIEWVRELMRGRFGQKEVDARVFDNDLARHSVILERTFATEVHSILDVGCAHGIFLNAAWLANPRNEVKLAGIDIQAYSLLVNLGWRRYEMDAVEMEFADKSFDLVVAAEILEHQSDGKFERALSEIRRVGKRRIITVPYNEPVPLPSYHKQRFTPARIEALFPGARITLLWKRKGKTPWVMIEEGGMDE